MHCHRAESVNVELFPQTAESVGSVNKLSIEETDELKLILTWIQPLSSWAHCGGGGGFFLACKDFGKMFNNAFPACAIFFFLVEISLCTLILLFTLGLVHSGSVSWDDCDQVFPDELRVSSFPERVPTLCLDSGIISPLWLCWVKGARMFRCNLPPAVLGEWPGSFACHCSNTEVERTPNKSQHTKLTLVKNTLLPLLPGFELGTYWSWVRCCNQQAIPAHYL